MPNTLDVKATEPKKIFMTGDTGSGKTTQFLTLPGKKYIYLFDPNAKLALRGYDVDYDEYLPTTVSAAVSSLTKGKADSRGTTTSDVYQRFESEFDQRIKSGFFDPYDWLGFDSATTLLDLIMDRVLTMNGRFGQWPQQDDYGPQMAAFINMCRTVTAMGKGLYVTGHLEEKQDQITKRITTRPMMTGRLIVKVPLLFSDVFVAGSDLDEKGNVVYTIQTVRSGNLVACRTSIKGLNPIENVTIQWFEKNKDNEIIKKLDPVGQGLGGILSWEARQANI